MSDYDPVLDKVSVLDKDKARRAAKHPDRPGEKCRADPGTWAPLKSRAHKRQTAYTPNADACRACGLCVVACPEKAIVLTQR